MEGPFVLHIPREIILLVVFLGICGCIWLVIEAIISLIELLIRFSIYNRRTRIRRKEALSSLLIDALEAKSEGGFLLLLLQSDQCFMTLQPASLVTGVKLRYFQGVQPDYKIVKWRVGDTEKSLLRLSAVKPGQFVCVWPTELSDQKADKIPASMRQFLSERLKRSELIGLMPVVKNDHEQGVSYAICTIG